MELDQIGGQKNEHSPYAGRWIACIGGKIVGQGGTPKQAFKAAQASRYKEIPKVSYVSNNPPIQIHPILERLTTILPAGKPAYVVGGAIRNALLRSQVSELDFILQGDAIKTARKVADILDGAYYTLDSERDYGRVIIPESNGERLVLDFAPLQGNTLEEDLTKRDFTINAIAAEVHRPLELLDPLGGAADLYSKRLRVCSPKAITSDPIRVLRGIRFAILFDMKPDLNTKAEMRSAVHQLQDISAERIRDELFRLLESPKPAAAIRVLDNLEAISYILPELNSLKDTEQSPPHTSDVWNHSLEVLTRLSQVLAVLHPSYNPDDSASLILGVISHRLGRYREQINSHLNTKLNPNRELIALIFLSALFHDIGKPVTKQVDSNGQISFIKHEEIGADLVEKRCQELQLSSLESKRARLIVLHHMRPLWLTQTGKLPSRRAAFRFFRDTELAGVDICLLSLADTLATYGSTLPQDLWAQQIDVVRYLLEAWWEKNEEVISPPPLVNGNDLIENLDLKPGSIIGQLLGEIQEAQATGKIINKRQAIELAAEIKDKLIKDDTT